MTEEMTPEQYQAEISKQKPHKYGAKKTEIDGFVFDSKREANYYAELKLRERAGEIVDLELQPKFECRVNGNLICNYIADFRFVYTGSGFQETVDVKGMKTPVYRLKKKLVEALFNITITEVT